MTRVLRSSLRHGLRGLATMAAASAADVLNVVFPSDCRVCGGPFLGHGPARVCRGCLDAAGRPATDFSGYVCSRCGDRLAPESARFQASLGGAACAACRLAPPEFARAVSAGVYAGELREMLRLLKFAGQRPVATHVLGAWLARAVQTLRAEAGGELVVVPVPLFAARERERGFNQALLLAQAAVRALRRTEPAWRLRLAPGALRRVKATRAMYALAPRERRATLRGAFTAPLGGRRVIAGREVLLVDDIMTTGATARECARVLLAAGAAKVWVATVARAGQEIGGGSEVLMWGPKQVVEPDAARRQGF